MKNVLYSLLLVLGLASSASAQQTTEQKIYDVTSYGTLGVNMALDFRTAWTSTDRKGEVGKYVTRVGVTWLGVAVIKHYFPTARPCAPQCGIDDPMADIPSGHTAFAVATLDFNGSGKRLAVGVPLATLTAVFRKTATKHDLLGIGVGAGVGLLTGQIR